MRCTLYHLRWVHPLNSLDLRAGCILQKLGCYDLDEAVYIRAHQSSTGAKADGGICHDSLIVLVHLQYYDDAALLHRDWWNSLTGGIVLTLCK